MDNKNDDILSKDPNLPQEIFTILNECYHSFKIKHGEKHSEHIKTLIESITDKVRKADLYYTGSIATASFDGIIYTESDKLPSILKHELWHVFNTSANNENPLWYTPRRYVTQLEQNGYLKNLYEQTMEQAKQKWKDDPIRLEFVLVNFNTFLHEYGVDDHEIEKWTEWFSSITNVQDMTNNFWDWRNGFFTKHTSSKSFYDCYINIADMVSCLIPKEKLLEMYLQTDDYPTDYSYSQMIDDFDEQYSDALDEQEKSKYKYPYLKIIMDTKIISDNARKNPELARSALQSCMKTCFNAYFIKLENITDFDVATAKQLYAEIKHMQEHMMWNTDLSKMQDLDSVQAMKKIESKFKSLLQTLDLENPEVKNMLETISFEENTPFEFIQDGEKIAKRLSLAENSPKTDVLNIGNYKISTSKNGIKDNLYCTLSTLLGSKKFNLLFKDYQGDTDNILVNFYIRIEQASTEEDFINIYNDIYELYAKKLETTLKTNQNIDVLFKRYKTELIELQENALFNEQEQSYPPALEKVISIYKEKAQEYQRIIDTITERRVLESIQRNENSPENAGKWERKFASDYKKELQGGIVEIDSKRAVIYERLASFSTFYSQRLDEDLTHIISEVKISDFNDISYDIKSTEKADEQSLVTNSQQEQKVD